MISTIKKRLIHRTKILSGQINGIEKMIEDERYCLDIINQNIAIQKSLSSLNQLLIENHIRTHLSDQLGSKDENEVERAVEEMVKLYGRKMESGESTEATVKDNGNCCH